MAMPWTRKSADGYARHQTVNPLYRTFEAVGKAVTSPAKLVAYAFRPHGAQVYAIQTQERAGTSTIDASPHPKEVPERAPEKVPTPPPGKKPFYENPLVMIGSAALLLASIGAAVKFGPDIYHSIRNNGQTASQPSAPVDGERPATAPQYFLETPDGRIEFPGLTETDVQPYLDQIHRRVVADNGKQFNGVVADVYKYVDGKLVKQDGKKLLRSAVRANGSVVTELECGLYADMLTCDDETLEKLADKSEDTYNFIMNALQPSKKPGIYVTVSPDGKRANVTYFFDNNQLNYGRRSLTSFYPWHVTDDFDQMLWESGVKIASGLEYTHPSEGFLGDFWGATMIQIKGGLKGEPSSGGYSVDRSVAGLAGNVSAALVNDGFDASKFTQLAQRLEGKNAKWEQFKAEAKAVAGKDLPTLDRLDAEVNAYREDIKKPASGSQSRTINDRSSELARIFKEYPELDTPTYRKAYEGQFA